MIDVASSAGPAVSQPTLSQSAAVTSAPWQCQQARTSAAINKGRRGMGNSIVCAKLLRSLFSGVAVILFVRY